MRSLPRAAKMYAVGIYALGLLVGVLALRVRGPSAVFERWELAVFLVLSVLAGSRKVQLIRGTIYDRVGSMSLGFVITFAAILRFGPSVAVLIAAISCFCGCLHPKRQPAYQLAFNVALTSVTAWISALVFVHLNADTLVLRAPAS